VSHKFGITSALSLLPLMLSQLRGVHTVQQLCLGFSHSLSIGKHGDVYSWGIDENGSLGQGFKWPQPGAAVPTAVPVRLVGGAAGWKHSAGACGPTRPAGATWAFGSTRGGFALVLHWGFGLEHCKLQPAKLWLSFPCS